MSTLKKTPLYDLHLELGAKMVPFAGYDMPVQYPAGVMAEHKHTRAKAGLFDVSHMGQVIVRGTDYQQAALALESLIPVDVLSLGLNRQRYGFFTNDQGGIQDDLMLANRGDHVFVVVNAACKDQDLAHMQAHLGDVAVEHVTDRALLALQGPSSEAVLSALDPAASAMRFMDVATLSLAGQGLSLVSRHRDLVPILARIARARDPALGARKTKHRDVHKAHGRRSRV